MQKNQADLKPVTPEYQSEPVRASVAIPDLTADHDEYQPERKQAATSGICGLP